jgi:putative ABC transport system permease protein
MTVFDEPTAQRLFLDGADAYTDVWVTAEDGVSQQELRAAVAAELPAGYEAVTGDDAAEDAGGDLMDAISFITAFLLVFAGISLVVGSFLIVNTFTILVAQRTRELALLRALGASRRQVTGSVLLEAAALGVVGATVGLVVGVLLAIGIRALFSTFGLDLSGQPLVFTPRTVVAAYVVGVLVTVLAAAVPARRASRVAPVEGLRDGAEHAGASLRTRVLAGLALLATGAGALVAALLQAPHATWWMAGGVLGLLLGAVVAAPLLARPLIGSVGALYRRIFGTPGRLAGQNAVRNPRRTAATASALMIGLSLVTMMSVLGASAGASVDRAVGDRFVGDIVVSDVTSSGLSPTVADEVETVPGVESVTRVRYGIGETGGQRQGIAAVDLDGLSDVLALEMREGTAAGLSEGSVLVSTSWAQDHGLEVGDAVAWTMPTGEKRYRVAGIYEDDPVISYPFVTSLETRSAAGFVDADAYLLVAATEGASVPQVQAALEELTADLPTVSVQDQAGFAEQQRGPIDQLVLLVYALLGLALVIAVLGIANTLALSVIERTREVGLLRAVGLARPQLRRMVRLEAAAIGLLGGVLGTLLGVVCGLVVAATLRTEGLEVISVPWGQIGTFALASAVVAVAAAALPARRAARLDILRAIGTD